MGLNEPTHKDCKGAYTHRLQGEAQCTRRLQGGRSARARGRAHTHKHTHTHSRGGARAEEREEAAAAAAAAAVSDRSVASLVPFLYRSALWSHPSPCQSYAVPHPSYISLANGATRVIASH